MRHLSLISMSVLASFAITTSGCATVFKSKQASIAVSSASPGADVLVNGQHVGQTPTTVELSHKADHVITVRSAGKEESCRLVSSASVGWIVLDVVTAGGWLIDLITGNWKSLDTSECSVAI